MTTGVVVFVCLVIIYILALLGRSPLWIYWVIFVGGVVVPIFYSIYYIHVERNELATATVHSVGGFSFIVLFLVCVWVVLFAIVLLFVRFVIPEALPQFLNLVLLRTV